MDSETYLSLQSLLDYVREDECRDWEESGRPFNHIYLDIVRLDGWAQEVAKDY